MTLKVYGIPNCGTCKKALQWLVDHHIDHQFINTKEHPPTQEMIEDWVKRLGAKSLRNTSGLSYRALGEAKQTWTDDQWVDAFAQDAMLIKRPLFVKQETAVMVGFRGADAEILKKLS
jgi:arsenate reductase (glutaredoxin)